MSEAKWCEHMNEAGHLQEHIGNLTATCFYTKRFKFCPVCGTPRPKEPKKLVEKLMEGFNVTLHHRVTAEGVAEFAKAEFLRVINEWHNEPYSYLSDLRRKVEEM